MPTTMTRPASSRHSSTYARSAVYLAFRGRDARALDQADFVDRAPNQVSRRHTDAIPRWQSVLERLAVALSQVGGEAGT